MTPTAAERLRVSTLKSRPTAIDVSPDADTRARITEKLDLLALRKARLTGELVPEGREGWRLKAKLGATVVQPCVTTLDPVTTRIDEEIERLWLPEDRLITPEAGSETETPEDDADPLPDVIDLIAVFQEALSLALPPYPRSPDAPEPTEPEPSEDDEYERPNPFAALAKLKQPSPGDGSGQE